MTIEPSARNTIARNPAKSLNVINSSAHGVSLNTSRICSTRASMSRLRREDRHTLLSGNIRMRLVARPLSTTLRSSQLTHWVVPQYMMMRCDSFIQASTRDCHSSSESSTRAAPGWGTVSFGEPIAMNGPKRWKWLASRVSREKSSTARCDVP